MIVAVIGAGTMGAGIAQLCAMSGHETGLTDLEHAQLDRARRDIDSSLSRLVARERISDADAVEARARLKFDLGVGKTVRNAQIVIETVVELLDAKQEVFRQIVADAPDHALLGTNTSQLSITRIASAVPDAADRVVGVHFFNPPVLMRLVEVIQGLRTSESSAERAVAFATSLGKETVRCRKDSPGFITSRLSAIVRLECLRMLEEGVASPADIDRAARLGFNWPMGPLELGDANGLDTFLHIAESLEETLDARFRPTVTLRNLVAAGRLGRKTGGGEIYEYDDEGRVVGRSSPAVG